MEKPKYDSDQLEKIKDRINDLEMRLCPTINHAKWADFNNKTTDCYRWLRMIGTEHPYMIDEDHATYKKLYEEWDQLNKAASESEP